MEYILSQYFREDGHVKNNTSRYSYLYYTYCCRITGTCTRMYYTQNSTARKWHRLMLASKSLCGCLWTGIDLSLGIGIDFVLGEDRRWLGLESWSKFTWFSGRGSFKIDLFLEWGSKLTWLQCSGRNLLGFWVRDRNWIGVWVVIENDLFLIRESNLTSVLGAGRKGDWF